MMQGRCFGQCLRDDNDYPVAWIRQHGKGRVFYTSVGHSPARFWDPRMLDMFLAGVQYALGDLQADATPRPRSTRGFDDALAAMAHYDWGQDRARGAPVREGARARRRDQSRRGRGRDKDAEDPAEQRAPRSQGCHLPSAGHLWLVAFGTCAQQMLRQKDTEAMARYALHGLQAK